MASSNSDTEAKYRASSDRVAQRFPAHSRAHIDEILRHEYAAYVGRPIQTYVSNLAEHSTRSKLIRETNQVTSAPKSRTM